MILKEEEKNILEQSEKFKEKSFFIGNEEKILELLRNDLYEDPILAFIREIAANARDANREAGNENIPIDITLPNAFDSSLKIKDRGPGLSPDRIETVFLGYGLSTKTETNSQTGGFGLGAKSPFAYTDQFTISTVYSGIRRTYLSIKEGSGKLSLIEETVTEELSGTEILIPIKSGDIKYVRDLIKDIFEFWQIKPNIFGYSSKVEEPLPVKEILIENDFFAVVYPPQQSLVLIDGFKYSFTECTKIINIAYLSLLLKFNNGELNLAISRDNLHYDAETISAINQRLEYVFLTIRDLIVDFVQRASSYKEAMVRLAKVSSCLRNNYQYSKTFFPDKILWRDIIVKSSIETYDIGKWCCAYKYIRGYKSRKETSFICSGADEKVYHSSSDQIDKKIINEQFAVDPTIKTITVFCTSQLPKSQDFLDAIKENPATVVEYNTKLIQYLNFEKFEDLKLSVNSQNLTEKSSRLKNEKDFSFLVGKRLKDNGSDFVSITKFSERVKNSGGIYVVIDNEEKSFLIEGLISTPFMARISSKLFSILNEKVYVFSPTRTKHLRESWIPFGVAIKNKLNKALSEINYIDFLEKKEYLEFEANSWKYARFLAKIAEKLGEEFVEREFSRFMKLTNKFFSLDITMLSAFKESIVKNWPELSSKFDEELFPKFEIETELSFILDKIDRKYPMLKFLSHLDKNADINYVVNHYLLK